MSSTFRIAAFLAAAAAAASPLTGCGQAPQSGSAPPPDTAAPGPSSLARQGRHEEAASAWLAQAAGAAPETAAALRLRAAEAWWTAGRGARAGEAARSIDPARLGPQDRTRRALLLARAALAEAAGREAFDALPSLEDVLRLPEPAAALDLAVRAARRAERPIDEIRFRTALDPRLDDPAANRTALWSLVRALPGRTLESPPAGLEGAAGGWIELGRLARAHRADFAAFSAAARGWRQRYPDHPAAAAVLPELTARIRREGSPPSHVALLLPLSGTFATAAAAVRDGFLAGWYTEKGDRPAVSIYDTAADEPETVFRTAVSDGADFVVGPLRKEAIARIASLPGRSVPLLVLNALESVHEPEEGAPTLYRFTLSPEDEARALADRARGDGHARAGLLVPDTEWGKRVEEAFTERWEASGAVVAGRSVYRGAAEDLAQPVRELLRIDANAERARRLRRTVRRAVTHQPLPRRDLDFVFLAGFPREARLLRPQITFLRAPDLPIYSTSHVFTGVPEPKRDVDLEGVVFSDMPWVLNRPSTLDDGALRERITALWPAAGEGFTRYYAFGLDGWRLQRRLHHLAAHPGEAVSGHTGRLSVEGDGRVRIDRAWARFRNGVPVPFSPST